MSNGISDRTWDRTADVGTKLDILRDLVIETNCRVQALENRKWLHATLQFLGGAVGGIAAAVVCLKTIGFAVFK